MVDGAGRVAAMAKSVTTPGDQSLGVVEALSLAASALWNGVGAVSGEFAEALSTVTLKGRCRTFGTP